MCFISAVAMDINFAILGEVVGPQGIVTAIEINPELAARERSNLTHMAHVTVIHGDGSEIDSETNDAIFINAGPTHPPSACSLR